MGFTGGNITMIGGGGTGDMTRAVYDINNNSIVDKAETLDDGVNSATAAEVRNLLDNPPQGDKNYVHNQNTSSTLWIVQHDLGKRVAVTVVNTGGTEILAEINYVDDNILTVSVSPAMMGKAYCN